jgi:glycosyltransferase involved in cell wall biosynthesis
VNNLNIILIGSFLYPQAYAATKRKQQFLDYIMRQGDIARVLITLNKSKKNKHNSTKGVYKGIPFEVLGDKVKFNALFPFTFCVFTIKSFHRLLLYKKRNHKNILVAFGTNFDTFLILSFAKLAGYKIVFDIVEDFSTMQVTRGVKNKVKYWVLSVFPRLLIKASSGISVISKSLFNKYASIGYKAPLVLIPISAENLEMDLYKTSNREFSLLYSGTYGAKEDYKTLFLAFSRFIKIVPDSKLILTGVLPEEIKLLLIDILGDWDKVKFCGYLNEVDYYQEITNADVLLMTRTDSAFANSGFPYKLGEYLASGNPTICTKISDIQIYLKDKVSAFLIEPKNVVDLVNSMQFIFSNPEFATIVGKRGIDVCKEHFNPRLNSKLFYDLLQSI